jgi:hypothetical protein
MRFGVMSTQYQQEFDHATSAGYRPELVDVCEVGPNLIFSAVFRPNDVAWRAQHHLDGAEYQQAYDTNKVDGNRLHNITSYARGGVVNYAAIWLKQAGPSLRAYHGRSAEQHEQLVDTYTRTATTPSMCRWPHPRAPAATRRCGTWVIPVAGDPGRR